ncbi:hypothetical protein AALP_AA6G127500 [Arabis alpina]|uniref:NB-ARC domain-containing protein n=1 Tax=Arabis alpina TaxID=50452 RepID=A0A087GNV6_ARAAL|nr:hypothetical protein AALP_AA6G127500 [Arabis alpina]
MPQEISQHGKDFKDRFSTNYTKWFNKTLEIDEVEAVVDKSTYLSPAILENREVKDEQDRVETNSALPKQKIHGFNNEIKSLKNFLLDRKVYKDFKSLVIVGEYGVGKTALCQTIFNDKDVKSVYAPMIWVSMPVKETVAGEDKKISVLKKILTDLGVEDRVFTAIHEEAKQEAKAKQEKGEETGITNASEEISALLYALHLNLRWKKYLIVFDDVREADEWNQILEDDEEKLKKDKRWGRYLSDGFPKGSGGRVIYTTRDEKKKLAEKLVAEKHEIHRLWPLTDPKSVWDIYEEAIIENKQKEPPRNDKKCIDELMNKSRGLPLAVRLMATLLPVFLDSENAAEDGSAIGTASNAAPASDANTTAQTPQA